MKFVYLGAAICLLPGMQLKAIAQVEADYVCFMTTNSGQVVDLSQSICKLTQSPQPVAAPVAVSNDQAFIADYKRTLMSYPDVRDKLLTSMEKSPEASISQAKSICNDLKAGISLNDIQQNQVDAATSKAAVFNVSLVTHLATRYYCPEFNNP